MPTRLPRSPGSGRSPMKARCTIWPSSITTVPSVPLISSRWAKPGKTAVLATIVPTAPELNFRTASATSSTSTWWVWVMQTPVTSASGPMLQRSRST